MGLSFVVVGSFLIFTYSHFFIGAEKTKSEYHDYEVAGRKFKPFDWNKGKFILITFFYIALQFVFIYFAYSTLYSQNIWPFIFMMKVIQIIM